MYLEGLVILILSLKASGVPVKYSPNVEINISTEKALKYLKKYGYSDLPVSVSGVPLAESVSQESVNWSALECFEWSWSTPV